MDFFSSRSNVMQGAVAGGTIRLDVAKLVDLKTRAKSKIRSIAGLNWYMEAELCDWVSPFVRGESLDVYVHCISERTGWSCEADINYTLTKGSGELVDNVMTTNRFPTQDGCPAKLMWSNILNPLHSPLLRGYDGIVIEAAVAVKDVAGIQDVSTAHSMGEPLFDFTIPQPEIPTVALVINEKRLYVSKEFFSNFLEKDKKEIPLEDIDVDEFLEFLHVMYPSRKAVTEANIDCLLSLGDRFNSKVVMRECKAFLCGAGYSKLPLEKKLLYADRFGLSRLQDEGKAIIVNIS